jgi:glycosyltransferase involved in cell wall biosynthesis
MIQEKISVIIPTFNRINELKQCIDSVLNQDYSNIEIIVVSDGYDINIEKVLSEDYYSKVNYYFTEKWTGTPAAARNLGLIKSSADLIAFCDDDDLWVFNKLTVQVNFLTSNNYSLVSSNAYIFSSYMPSNTSLFLKNIVKTEPIIYLVFRNQIMTSTVLFRKSLFFISQYNNLFDLNLSVGEDWIAWLKLRCSTKIPFGYLSHPLIYYRLSNNSLSKNFNSKILIVMHYKVSKLLFNNSFYLTNLLAQVFFFMRWIRYLVYKK